jgi:3-hydroxyisobutyrate dehydrogenase
MTKVAFLGLGAMGSRMAARLLRAGYDVTVWNRSGGAAARLEQAGAHVMATPRAAAERADIVIAMVRDDTASRFVWLGNIGALEGMQPNSVAIDSSTLTVSWITDLAKHAGERRIAFLDAPVLGSRPQAEAAQLIYLVGGRDETLNRVRPVLQAMAAAVHHVGDTGAGAALKLAANALFGIQVVAIAELFGLLQRKGLDMPRALEILEATPLMSPSAKGAAMQMLSGTFAPLFPVELVEKDFGYAAEAAKFCGARVPMIEAARTVYAEALRTGLGAENLTGVVRLYGAAEPHSR